MQQTSCLTGLEPRLEQLETRPSSAPSSTASTQPTGGRDPHEADDTIARITADKLVRWETPQEAMGELLRDVGAAELEVQGLPAGRRFMVRP